MGNRVGYPASPHAWKGITVLQKSDWIKVWYAVKSSNTAHKFLQENKENYQTGVKQMEFKGSRTEKNVLAAFAGESQAHTRYSFFASAARKEGYEQIGSVFQQTSEEEKEPQLQS